MVSIARALTSNLSPLTFVIGFKAYNCAQLDDGSVTEANVLLFHLIAPSSIKSCVLSRQVPTFRTPPYCRRHGFFCSRLDLGLGSDWPRLFALFAVATASLLLSLLI